MTEHLNTRDGVWLLPRIIDITMFSIKYIAVWTSVFSKLSTCIKFTNSLQIISGCTFSSTKQAFQYLNGPNFMLWQT